MNDLLNKDIDIFTDLKLNEPPRRDLLQGTFINTTGSGATNPQSTINTEKALPITARIHSSRELMDQFRLIKSKKEIELMQKSAEIGSNAIIQGMKMTRPGLSEHQLHAIIEYHSKMLGASGLAYVPVIAGGTNALILHYVTNHNVLKGGDLVLVDAGCEYEYYASDITRTWPVNGKFSAEQAIIYQIVLDCQLEMIKHCKIGNNLNSLQDLAFEYFHSELNKLFARKLTRAEMLDIYPHHLGHYIGMDVHDCPTISRSTKFYEGMAITIEPGLYIPESPKYGKFGGIGVRIEDDVVITEGEPLVLTAKAPKEIKEIEELMASASADSQLDR